MNRNRIAIPRIMVLSIACAVPALAHAADEASKEVNGSSADSSVFTLGQITVTAPRENETPVGTSTLNREKLRDFDKNGLAEALNLSPGVVTTSGSGNRNEALISVRGFDRWQVPLLMDGIRLYLPADNRIDFDRFLTPDLSEIQISKGYVSVLNGPDGMGGAINLVTRKPVKAFEGEVRSSLAFANNGQYNGNTTYADLGSRQSKYYYQISAEERNIQHWRVSNNFLPTVAENGGARDNSSKKDQRVNLKAGFTPNDTDEYSLNFVKQTGEKHGVGAVTGTSTISTWDWPTWDTWSAYWLSNTQLGSKSYIKTQAYYNKFVNDLVAYSNVSLTQKSWTSYYDDNAKGIGVELGTTALAQQTLKTSFHYRRDEHNEWQVTETTGFTEPRQTTIEDITSLALEDTWQISRQWDLVGGVSRDSRETKQAQEYANNVLFDQPTANRHATNYQLASIYRYSDVGKLHLSMSDRTRFPTMFERFSSRFGGAISNPWLKPERALNTELGVEQVFSENLRGEAALFHSRVEDSIQSVPIVYAGGNYTQSQNVGTAIFKGLELSLTTRVFDSLELGGNYSFIETHLINPNDSQARLTTTPQNKSMVWAKWKPVNALSIVPSVEYASTRWSAKAVGTGYVRTGQYALANLKIEYQIMPEWDVSLSGRNLFDRNYQLVDGYPEEGRNFILSTRVQF